MVVHIDNTKAAESMGDLYIQGELEATGSVKAASASLNGIISSNATGRAGGWLADAACAGVASQTQLTNATVAVGTSANDTILPTIPATGAAGSFNTDGTGDLWIIFTVGALKYYVPAWCASG